MPVETIRLLTIKLGRLVVSWEFLEGVEPGEQLVFAQARYDRPSIFESLSEHWLA